MSVPLGAVVLAIPGALLPASQAGPPNAARPSIVLHVAGIGVGMLSTDTDVIALHGQGLFVESEGHAGGRYFVNARGTMTLHTVIGVDGSTESLELRAGLHVPGAAVTSIPAAAVSPALDAVRLADHRITLGLSADKLLSKLGRPATDEIENGRRVLTYSTTSDIDDRVSFFYTARYAFVSDRLVTISLYDGE